VTVLLLKEAVILSFKILPGIRMDKLIHYQNNRITEQQFYAVNIRFKWCASEAPRILKLGTEFELPASCSGRFTTVQKSPGHPLCMGWFLNSSERQNRDPCLTVSVSLYQVSCWYPRGTSYCRLSVIRPPSQLSNASRLWVFHYFVEAETCFK